MMTRCIEVGDEESCVVRWATNFANRGDSGLGSVKSRFGRRETGTNCNCPDVGKMRRLLRSKSWQNMDCCEVEGDPDACGTLLSEIRISFCN